MRIELKAFKSKVARRIFGLFMLCAIAPVSALALISFFHVKDQLYDQSRNRLRQEAKSAAVSIYERLVFLRGDVEAMAAALCLPSKHTGQTDFEGLKTLHPDRFNSLGIFKQGQMTVLSGKLPHPDNLDTGALSHLLSGKPLLKVHRGPENEISISLLSAIDPRKPELGMVWGGINPAYLWETAYRLPKETELFVISKKDATLFSTMADLPAVPDEIIARISRSHSGQFEWFHGSNRYFSSYTNIFFKSNFFYPEWIIVVSVPEGQILKPMANFKLTFPILFVLSLGMVFYLSLHLIRKNLEPIDQLRQGTRRIAKGDLDYNVDIRSDNEFENLGEAFNEMSRQLKKGQELLVRTARMATTGQMASGVIHEVKQPMSAIFGQIQLALMDAPEGELHDRLTIIMEAVERLNTIVERFRTFASPTQRSFKPLHLETVISQVSRLMSHQLQAKKMELLFDIQPGIPEIHGDIHGLQQVISNIIINATHALEKNDVEDRAIHIRLYPENRHAVLEISDNGCGMPKEVQARIFDPFFSTKPPEKGTGLGMAIVETILHNHEAALTIESKEGAGTKFTIRFPEPDLQEAS